MPLRTNGPHENLVRANNILKQAEEKLTKLSCATEAEEFLGPVAEAIRQLFASPQTGRGFAAFASEGFHREFATPLDLIETVDVGRRFHILPLLPLFSEDDRFYILALSQKHMRLFSADRAGAYEVRSEGLPAEFDQAHRDFLSEGFEKELQFHATSAGGAGRRSVIYHGGADEPKDRFAGYLRQTTADVFKNLKLGGAPLVIATVERLASVYREINPYPNLVDDFVAGNPDLLKTPELHAKALDVVERYFAVNRTQYVERFKRFPKQLTGYDTHEIAAAAKAGRVRTLFIANGARKGDGEGEDLFNLAASLTLRDGGAVHALPLAEMPEKAEIAAAYRY
jgi:hypothetical protein